MSNLIKTVEYAGKQYGITYNSVPICESSDKENIEYIWQLMLNDDYRAQKGLAEMKEKLANKKGD